MKAKKTLAERERELQTLLGNTEGRKQLEDLAARYGRESGRPRPHGTSVITYLLVHERSCGLLQT